MRLIGNLIWFVFGGIFLGIAWFLLGLLAFLTIVGIPWGRACLTISNFCFFPFGREAISRRELYQRDDIGTGGLGLIGNVIWFVFAGLWLAIGHVCSALFCFVTIIGIPFGIQHLKLAGIAIAPIGQTIVSREVAEAGRRSSAQARVETLRRR